MNTRRGLPRSRSSRQRLPGAAIGLAAAATLAVAYSYLVPLWLNRHGYSPSFVTAVREWINKPTGISDDFGPLGVCVLLIIAGYAMTDTVWRRGLRVVAALTWIVPLAACTTALSLLTSLTLDEQVPRLAFWPLAICATFGLVLLSTLSLLKLAPWLAVVIQLAAVGVASALAASFVPAAAIGDGPRTVALIACFASAPHLGELIWLNKARRLPTAAAVPLGLACIGLVILAEHMFVELAPWWYPVSVCYAVLLASLALNSDSQRHPSTPGAWLASRSMALLLTIGSIGYGTLTALAPVSLAIAYPVAFLATGLVGDLLCRWVADPSARLVDRRLSVTRSLE